MQEEDKRQEHINPRTRQLQMEMTEVSAIQAKLVDKFQSLNEKIDAMC